MEEEEPPNLAQTQREEFQARQYLLKIIPTNLTKPLKILTPMWNKYLSPVPPREQFERYYLRLKENKHWLKDVRNRSSFQAIRAHLQYCQADFQSMERLLGRERTLARTKNWNPMSLTANHFFTRVESPPRPRAPPSRPNSRMSNPHSRHPRNVSKNRAWRSSIYEEMIRMARSLQGTYQHLEKGKIQRQEAMHQHHQE